MKKTWTLAAIGALAFASFGFAQAPAASVNPLVMKINGDEVHAAEISLMMQNIQGFLLSQGQQPTEEQVFQMASQRIVEQKLIAQEAKRQGLKSDPQQVAQMMQMTEQQVGGKENLEKALAGAGTSVTELERIFTEMDLNRVFIAERIQPSVKVSDEEVKKVYDDRPELFERPEQVHARHILYTVEQGADEITDAAARSNAEQARQRAVAGEDFAELAKELSQGPSAPRGGDLGFFSKDRMVPQFAEAAFALQPGEISGVVKTQFGYHVIKVEERRDAEKVSFEEAEPQIRDMLVSQKTVEATASLVETLGETATIQFFDEQGNVVQQDPQAAAGG